MLSLVTLDDYLQYPTILHKDTVNGKRWLTSATGLRGVQGLRINRRVKSQRAGGINETRFEDGRNITLIGEIMSQVSIEDAFAEFAIIAGAMVQTLDNGPALLKWTEGASGNMLQRLVKLDGDLDPPFQDGAAILTYQAQFFSEDPRAYSQTLYTFSSTALATTGGGHVFPTKYPRTYASSGGGTVSVTNGGNRSTPPLFRIYGAVTNPQIVWLDAGLRLVFNGTINAGDYLEVDVAKRTVKLNGTTNRLNFYDGANSTWYDMPSGLSNLQLIAGNSGAFDPSARLDVLLRSAFA